MVKIKKTLIILFALIPAVSHAATFSYTISSNQIKVNNPFTVDVYINSDGKSVNAASANLVYDKNFLSTNSFSKDNSIISLWPDDLKILKDLGRVSFEGIILPPGFTGNSGKLFSLNFTPIKAGNTKINITNASILLNDGTGGNVLENVTPIGISITGEKGNVESLNTIPNDQKVKLEQKEVSFKKDSAEIDLNINSISHPDSNIWYKNSSPIFSWNKNSRITAVRTGISEIEDKKPTVVYSPPIFDKTVENLSDGIYYFSVQIKTKDGWGNIYKKVVKIDSTPPESFAPRVDFDKDLNGYKIYFETTDKISEKLRYEIKIDKGDFILTDSAQDNNPYILKDVSLGNHDLYLSVYDEAGNAREVHKTFTNDNVVVLKNNNSHYNFSLILIIFITVIFSSFALYLYKIIRDKKNKTRSLIKTICDSYDIFKEDITLLLEKDDVNIQEMKELMLNIKNEMDEAKNIIYEEFKSFNK